MSTFKSQGKWCRKVMEPTLNAACEVIQVSFVTVLGVCGTAWLCLTLVQPCRPPSGLVPSSISDVVRCRKVSQGCPAPVRQDFDLCAGRDTSNVHTEALNQRGKLQVSPLPALCTRPFVIMCRKVS